MEITPRSYQVREIFQLNKEEFYRIPIYQRNYSWGYDNIEIFFNDVNSEKEGYYIGNLLITPTINVEKSYDVVDGQQRLTTIALMFLAIYHILLEKEELLDLGDRDDKKLFTDLANKRYDLRRQLIYTDSDDNDRSRLILLDDDMKMYGEFLTILDDKLDYKPYKNRKFGKRYHFIKELIEDEFFEKDLEGNYKDFKKSIADTYTFSEKLNSLEILRIKVDNLTDAFSIFTSFNSKGLPLTLIDLLKSYYLKSATSSDLTDDEALDNWNELISYFEDDNGEARSNLVTQFLQNYYDTFESDSTSSITKSESLRKYENLFEENDDSYIEDLIESAEIFSSFTNNIGKFNENLNYTGPLSISEKDRDIDYYIRKLSKLEATSSYPILMFVLLNYKRSRISVKNLVNILKYLTEYYIRRNIVLKPKSSNLRAKALLAVRKLEKEDDLNKNALAHIKSSLDLIVSSDDEFLSSLIHSNIYEINKQTTRIMMIDLERQYNKSFHKQNPDSLDNRNEKGKYFWTIEHILPQSQNLSKSWKEAINIGGNLNDEQILLEHDKNIHKLGNLTLTGYNSEMSNSDFISKRDYQDSITKKYTGLKTELFLNESIFNGNLDKKSWNQKDIERRTKYLAKLIVDMYKN